MSSSPIAVYAIFFITFVLFVFGMLLLLIQAMRIAFSLLRLVYYLIKLAVYLALALVLGSVLLVRWCERREPEPVLMINITPDDDDADDASTIELPRTSFR